MALTTGFEIIELRHRANPFIVHKDTPFFQLRNQPVKRINHVETPARVVVPIEV